MDKIFLLDMFKILLDFLSKKRFVEFVNTIASKDSIVFKDFEYNTFEGKKVIKGKYLKDILRFLYLNKHNKNFKQLLLTNKVSFKKILSNCEDYQRVTSYDKNFKHLLLFLNNCGFFIKNPYKFNTVNSFTKIISNDLYHSNKGLHLIYSFNIFDYRLAKNKSDSKNTTVLYIPIGLYKSFIKWNEQDNNIIINDKYNFYLNYKDNNQITQYKTKKEFNVEDFYYYCKQYDNINKLDHEKLTYEDEYYLKLAYSFKQGEYDLVLENKPIKACFDACKPTISLGLSEGAHKLLLKSQQQDIDKKTKKQEQIKAYKTKQEYKKKIKLSSKKSKEFKTFCFINFEDLYNRGFIQSLDL